MQIRLPDRVGYRELGPLAKGGQKTPSAEEDRDPAPYKNLPSRPGHVLQEQTLPLRTPSTSFPETSPLLDPEHALQKLFPTTPKGNQTLSLLMPNPSYLSPQTLPLHNTSLYSQPFPLSTLVFRN